MRSNSARRWEFSFGLREFCFRNADFLRTQSFPDSVRSHARSFCLATCLRDLSFDDVAPQFHGLFLLTHLAGGGLERGLDLVDPLVNSSAEICARTSPALTGCPSTARTSVTRPAIWKETSTSVASIVPEARREVVALTMSEDVTNEECCSRQDSYHNKQRA